MNTAMLQHETVAVTPPVTTRNKRTSIGRRSPSNNFNRKLFQRNQAVFATGPLFEARRSLLVFREQRG